MNNQVLVSVLDHHHYGICHKSLEQYYVNPGSHFEVITEASSDLKTVNNLPFEVPAVRIPNLAVLRLTFQSGEDEVVMPFTVVLSDFAFDVLYRKENDNLTDHDDYENVVEAIISELFGQAMHNLYDIETCDILLSNLKRLSHTVVKGYVYKSSISTRRTTYYKIQYVRP